MPLIVALPGARARVVDDVVESLDVMPTILDLWGVRRREPYSSQAPPGSPVPDARRRA